MEIEEAVTLPRSEASINGMMLQSSNIRARSQLILTIIMIKLKLSSCDREERERDKILELESSSRISQVTDRWRLRKLVLKIMWECDCMLRASHCQGI